jgi:hypothetical protein
LIAREDCNSCSSFKGKITDINSEAKQIGKSSEKDAGNVIDDSAKVEEASQWVLCSEDTQAILPSDDLHALESARY